MASPNQLPVPCPEVSFVILSQKFPNSFTTFEPPSHHHMSPPSPHQSTTTATPVRRHHHHHHHRGDLPRRHLDHQDRLLHPNSSPLTLSLSLSLQILWLDAVKIGEIYKQWLSLSGFHLWKPMEWLLHVTLLKPSFFFSFFLILSKKFGLTWTGLTGTQFF